MKRATLHRTRPGWAIPTSVALVLSLSAASAAAQSELVSLHPAAVLSFLTGSVRSVSVGFHEDVAAFGGANGEVTLVDLRTGVARMRWRLDGSVDAVAFSRDGLCLAAGSSSGDVALIDLARGQLQKLSRSRPITSLVFSPRNDMLAGGTRSGDIHLWSIPLGTSIGLLREGHRKAVRSVGFASGEGATLISTGEDREIVFWDVKQLRALQQMRDVEQSLLAAAIEPRGGLLAVGTETFQRGSFGQPNVYRDLLRLYQVHPTSSQKVVDLQGRTPTALAISPDLHYVATGLVDVRGSSLALWDIERGISVIDMPADAKLHSLAFAPSGRFLALGTERGAQIFEVRGVIPRTAITDLQGRKYRITGSRTPLIASHRRVRLAVMELDDNGVGPEVARAIADQVDNRLAAHPAVRLVERRRIAAILNEQNFQHSGRTDPGTAVQLARILNVDRAILGSVGKLGTSISITLRSVDAMTAEISGVREVVCEACSLEDLYGAVAELAQVLVATPEPGEVNYPEPPVINVEYPQNGMEVARDSVIVRATVKYARELDGIELIVNGVALTAARLLEERAGKTTRLTSGLRSATLTQVVPLDQSSNVIAIRAIGGDGNDEQQYVNVRRVAAPNATTPTTPIGAPGVSLDELLTAIANKVPAPRLAQLIEKFGIAFAPNEAAVRTLRDAGADERLLAACARARQVHDRSG